MTADTKSRVEDIYLPYKPQAADQGADRPRSRARTVGRPNLGRSDPRSGGGRRRLPRRRRHRRRRGSRRGATHHHRTRRPRTPNSSEPSGRSSGPTARCARRHRRAMPRRALQRRSFATTSTSPNRWRRCRRTGCSPSCAARRSRCSRSTSTAVTTRCTRPWSRRRLGVNLTSAAAATSWLAYHGPAGVAGQADDHRRGRRPGPAAPTRRGGRRRGVRQEPQGPAARGARGHPHDARPGSRLPHGSQGRRRRRHRQGRRHRRDLPASTAEAVGRGQGHPRGAGRPPRRAADRDRQWHGVTRNRRPGNRTHRRHACRRCRAARRRRW